MSKPTTITLVGQDEGEADFEFKGPCAWLGIHKEGRKLPKGRKLDLRILNTTEKVSFALYYVEPKSGSDVVLDSLSYTWKELEKWFKEDYA